MLRLHWRVVAGWAAFNIIGMVAIVVAITMVTVGLVVTQAVDETALGGFGAFVVAAGDALIQTIVGVGLYRLLLRPDEPAFLCLRLGRDELRMLAIAAVTVCAFAAIAGAAYVLGRALHPFVGGAPLLFAAAAAGIGLWLWLRFSLAAPLSFVQRRIDFAGSWRLTRGRGWALFGMCILNLCVVLMVWIAWWIAAFVLVGLLTGFGGGGEGAEAFTSHPVRYLLEGASPLLFAPVFLVLQQTPFVAACRALAEAP